MLVETLLLHDVYLAWIILIRRHLVYPFTSNHIHLHQFTSIHIDPHHFMHALILPFSMHWISYVNLPSISSKLIHTRWFSINHVLSYPISFIYIQWTSHRYIHSHPFHFNYIHHIYSHSKTFIASIIIQLHS